MRNAGHLGSKYLSSHQGQEEGPSGGDRERLEFHVFMFDLVGFASPCPEPSTSSNSISAGNGEY